MVTLLISTCPYVLFNTFCQKAAVLDHLARTTSPVSRVQLTVATSSIMPTSMSTLLRTAQGTVAAAQSSLGQLAIRWVICCLSLTAPSTGLVFNVVLVLTLSQVSSFLLSALQAATISCKYDMPEVLDRYQMESWICFLTPSNRQSWRCCWASRSIIFLGIGAWFAWGSLQVLWQMSETSHCSPDSPCGSFVSLSMWEFHLVQLYIIFI